MNWIFCPDLARTTIWPEQQKPNPISVLAGFLSITENLDRNCVTLSPVKKPHTAINSSPATNGVPEID